MERRDKAKNKIDDLGGKAKEATGKVTGDKDTENEGKVDQAKSSLKDAGEKIKDAFKSWQYRLFTARHQGRWRAGLCLAPLDSGHSSF